MKALLPALFMIGILGFWQNSEARGMLSIEDKESLVDTFSQNRKRYESFLATEHVGIEILTADSFLGKVESAFGHSLIRFIDQDEDPLNDTVVGFEMQVLNSQELLTMGLTSGAINVPMIKTLVDVVDHYTVREKRPISRLILPADRNLIKRVKRNLYQAVEIPRLVGDYNFIKNNCLSALVKVLFESGYRVDGRPVDVPTLFSSRLYYDLLTPYPSVQIPSASALLSALDSQAKKICPVNVATKRSNDRNDNSNLLNQECFWQLVMGLSEKDLGILFHAWPIEFSNYKTKIAIAFGKKNSRQFGLVNFLNLENLPREFYAICDVHDSECRKLRFEKAVRKFSVASLRSNLDSFPARQAYEASRAKQLIGWKRDEILGRLTSPLVMDNVLFARELAHTFGR